MTTTPQGADAARRGREMVDTAETVLLALEHQPMSIERWVRMAQVLELRAAGWRLLADASGGDCDWFAHRAYQVAADSDRDRATVLRRRLPGGLPTYGLPDE